MHPDPQAENEILLYTPYFILPFLQRPPLSFHNLNLEMTKQSRRRHSSYLIAQVAALVASESSSKQQVSRGEPRSARYRGRRSVREIYASLALGVGE
jgi:hypothetical protein